MIKLIAGLGNPGQQYQKTRHNVGFLFLDHLLQSRSGSWSTESKFHGIIANSFIGSSKIILLKPQTFMNRSGLSVGSVARFYKLKAEEILVVHDELDFEAGVAKLKKGGGHAGHNGLRDIISHLNEKDFYRIRLGISRPAPGKSVSDYVLSKPSKDEQSLLIHAFDWIDSHLDTIISGNFSEAMNNLNKTSN